MKRIVEKYLPLLLFVLLLIDFGYSFVQYLHCNLDGDMAEGILRANRVDKVFHDPFGIGVFFSHECYPNPNRFFSHWSFSYYFQTFPLIIQKYFSPIDSIYISCAIVKLLFKILFIYLIASLISGTLNVLKRELLVAAIIITPLFQTFGYDGYMGVIIQSITYFFFYSIPLCLLVLFFVPVYFSLRNKSIINFPTKILMLFLVIILPFSGPLIPGIVIIACPIFIVYYHKQPLSRFIFHTFILFTIISLYSLYIGTLGSENFENASHTISIIERYSRLPLGIYNHLTQKIGLSLLLGAIIINTIIINNGHHQNGKPILKLFKALGLFCLLYLLLLPLGGYKIYRPNTLRFDTIMPITICMIFIYGLSTYFLINNINNKFRTLYVLGIIFFLSIFIIADKPKFDNNNCERQTLKTMATSSDNIVLLGADCNVLSWNKIKDYKDSELPAQLLFYWHVTSEKKYYYQNE